MSGQCAALQLFHEFAQASRGGIAIELARGYLQNELFPLIRRQLRVRQFSAFVVTP